MHSLKNDETSRTGGGTVDETFVEGADESHCLPAPLKIDKTCPPPPLQMEIDQVEATGEYAIEEYDSG